MSYTKEELTKLGFKNLEEARRKIVGMQIFDYIDDLVLTSDVEKIFKFTLELYQEYLDLLNEFSKTNKEKILRTLKNTEVVDNHSLEREDINLLSSYNETHHSTAINYLIKKLKTENIPLNSLILLKAHEILMRGTSNAAMVATGYRKNNNYYVGYKENDNLIVNYLPISYDEIEKAMNTLFNYFNSPFREEQELFTRPFITHGLLGALQVFEDGNTRIARTLQQVKIFDFTEKFIDSSIHQPAIYFSKSYIPYRYLYRELITNIAVCPSKENWNEWIKFNLNRIQDQIFINTEALNRTRKI